MKIMTGSGRTGSAIALTLIGMTATVLPAGPQTSARAQVAPESAEVRLRRIEAELRAVQRKVFPDGAGKAFGPEITPPVSGLAGSAPTPTAVTDLLARMETVEAQLQRLTAASEETQNHFAKLETRLAALEAAGAPNAPATSAVPSTSGTTSTPPVPPIEPVKSVKPLPKPAPIKVAGAKGEASPDRMAAVMAIEKPSTDDKGEDEYTYGYRLWEAKFFPEAQQQLLRVVQQYPRHVRISYARNLLGRAYLEDGKPGTAAQYFLQNYQADRKGDRAADSLLYLGVAMSRLKEEKRACLAFAEFRQNYAAELAGRLKSQYEAATKPVTCN